LRNIEIYEGNSNIIFVSTDDNIYRTTNGGGSFTDITGSLPTNSVITSIEVNPSNSNELWLTRGGWTSGSHVFYSTNGGSSWSNITANLPNLPTNIVKYDVGTNGGIYVGTDVGVYYYDNDLLTWMPFMNNLPNVIVNDLEIHENTNVIRAGTYGRGVWESPNYTSSDYDIGIENIASPDGSLCNSSSIEPVIVLINYGSVTLTSATITYDIDGNNSLNYNWTGSLAQGATEIINLPMMTTTSGAHVFNVTTSSPNGQTDENQNNDNSSSAFTIIVNGNPLTLNLTTDCWGSETTWEIISSNSTIVASGGPYTDVAGGEVLVEEFCLPDDCYDFIIYDSYGDGMFGSQYSSCAVDGDYYISDGGSTVYVQMTNPNFGNSITTNFCVPSNVLNANFTANLTTICEGESVNFADASSNGIPTGWNWVFTGATTTSSTVQNPSGIQYNTSGTYDVTLTVTDNTGSYNVTLSNYITVIANPTATVTPSQTICAGETLALTAGGAGTGGTYSWDNGLGVGNMQNVSPNATTTYNVTVTNSNGCNDVISTTVSVSPPIQLAVTPQNPAICAGESITLTASGASTYSWNNSSTTASITVTPNSSTTYTVIGTTGNCNSSPTNSLVTVNPASIAMASASSYNTVGGGLINFDNTGSTGTNFWDFGDGNTATSAMPSHSYSILGSYTVILRTTLGNCTATDTLTINVGATAVDENKLKNLFSVYPNPTSGLLTIVYKDEDVEFDLEIVNVVGAVILQESSQLQYCDVNMTGYAKGVYFLRIILKDQLLVQKITLN
jgi:PKD repeat protein